MFNKILLASDGSDHSIRAAEQAIQLAKGNPEAIVIVLYVEDSKTSKEDVLRNLDEEGITPLRKEKLASIEKKAQEAGINYEIKIIRGDPTSAITHYESENNIDVILIGSRGLKAL